MIKDVERNPLRGYAEPWYDFGRTSCYAALRSDNPVLHTDPGIQLTTDLLQCN